MAEAQPTLLEAEPDEWADNDSAIGSTSVASSTASLTSTIMKHREENGRTYHAYKDGSYNFPNDEGEKDRLDLQHHLFGLTFGGKLFLAPIPKEKTLHRVLDVGCGTGIWAIEFSDDHPESEVIGVDLSSIQPQFVPPNVSFQVDDLEEPWSFNYKFDFIYSRMMTGSFLDYPRFFEQCYENLSPGGWIECADICFPPLVDDDSLPPDSAFMKWALLMMDACEQIGRRSDAQKEFSEQLKAAGFKDVTVVKYVWPQNRWPKDKHLKMLGAWQLENFCGGLTGISVALFTRVLRMSTEEVTVFLALVAKEMKDTKIHAYWPISVVYGHKE